LTETNNFSQLKAIIIADPATYPDRNYLISEIQEVLRYSSQIHKITKLENHEGKEITPEELVDQYYKDPDRYFEVNRNKSDASPPGGGPASPSTAVAMEPIETKNIIKDVDDVSDEYSLDEKNRGKSQQIIEAHVKSVKNEQQQSTKLFDECKSNNLFIFKCYYCTYQTYDEREYEHHVVLRHQGKLAYPSEVDLEKMGVGRRYEQTAN
jgi:hypothetical protein